MDRLLVFLAGTTTRGLAPTDYIGVHGVFLGCV